MDYPLELIKANAMRKRALANERNMVGMCNKFISVGMADAADLFTQEAAEWKKAIEHIEGILLDQESQT